MGARALTKPTIPKRRKTGAGFAKRAKKTGMRVKSQLEQLDEYTHALSMAPAMVRKLDGEIVMWGRSLETLYGIPASEAIGKNANSLLRTEFPGPLTEIETELLQNGTWEGELSQRHRDGHRIIVFAQWALHRDRRGRPTSVLALNRDITEERRAQDIIEEREARLRLVVETAPDAIITIDERGIVQSFSSAAEKLFGYAAGEVIGHNVNILMPIPYRDEHDGYLAHYLRTGEKHIIGIGRQVEAVRKDGSVFPMELSVGEVRVGKSRIFTGFIRDLSARLRVEAELRQAQKMEAIGQLTGGVAHDFNNLLTVISGNLEMIEPHLVDQEDRDLLKEAQETTTLGAQLSKRLLAFARRQPLDQRPLDLNTLVAGLADMLRRTLGESIAVETRLAEGLPLTVTDAGQVENVLLNLAINARDAMPLGGRLIVETTRAVLDAEYAKEHVEVVPGVYVALAVTDTGTGMTPEVMRHAFEPFYTTKGPGAGSGLGLSMIYGFVKQSGGHVQLYSQLGHGTTVRIYLPSQPDKAGASPSTPLPTPHVATGQAILVVEDDARVRRVSVRRLRQLGYSVREAESGPGALKILDEGGHLDLLFTDVVMSGGMNGVELAQEAQRRRPGLKILFTSGFAEPAIQMKGSLASDAGWLSKPYAIAELQEKLGKVFDS